MDEGFTIIILGLVILGIVTAFCIVAIKLLYSGARKSMKTKGVLMTATAEARITQLRTYRNVDSYTASNKDMSDSWPDVEYEFTAGGKTYTGKGPGSGAKDTTIKIYYNPDDPEMNCTETQMDLWNGKTGNKTIKIVLVIVGVLAGLLLLAGLFSIVFR